MKSFTLNIEDDLFERLIGPVFYEKPVPQIPVLDDNGNPTFTAYGEQILEPKYSDLTHVKVLAMQGLSVHYCRGIKHRDGQVGRDNIDRELIQTIIDSNLGET